MPSKEVVELWKIIIYEAKKSLKKEPILSNLYINSILKHNTLSSSLSYILSNKLSTVVVSAKHLQNLFYEIYLKNTCILDVVAKDLKFIVKKDPVVNNYIIPFLYFKGFHALESYRISHYLWNNKQYELSMYLQSRISSIFSVDIHPASCIGSGIMLDHATGIVIGEGVIIENNVLILHSVTLGSTGKDNSKNRHPIIRSKVTIGSGAKILGNIEVGYESKIGAGAVVLKNIPPYSTVVGIPAKIIKQLNNTTSLFKKEKNEFSEYTKYFKYGDGI